MESDRDAVERWTTPVSDAGSLAMVSLVDEGVLHVTVQDLRDPERRRFRFSFSRVAAYRNILEEYRLSEANSGERLGWTRLERESKWLADLRSHEPLLDVHSPGCHHYVIVTEDDVIDVLTPETPQVVEVAPAAAEDPAPGKSNVLYDPEDRRRIDLVLDETRRRADVRSVPPTGMHRLLMAFIGAVVVGGMAGALGLVLPLVVAPSASQGPLLGLFVTGPAGAIIGAALGLSLPSRSGRPPTSREP